MTEAGQPRVPGTQDPHQFQTFLPPLRTVGKRAEGGLWTQLGWMERGESAEKPPQQGWEPAPAWVAGPEGPLATPNSLSLSQLLPHLGASWRGLSRGQPFLPALSSGGWLPLFFLEAG